MIGRPQPWDWLEVSQWWFDLKGTATRFGEKRKKKKRKEKTQAHTTLCHRTYSISYPRPPNKQQVFSVHVLIFVVTG